MIADEVARQGINRAANEEQPALIDDRLARNAGQGQGRFQLADEESPVLNAGFPNTVLRIVEVQLGDDTLKLTPSFLDVSETRHVFRQLVLEYDRRAAGCQLRKVLQ